MSNKSMSENFIELQDVTKSYIDSKINLWKVLFLQKTTKAGTYLLTSVVIIMSAFSFILFLLLAFSFWYGESHGSIAMGFLISAGAVIFLMLLIYLLRRVLFSRHILQNQRKFLFPEQEKTE